MGGREQHRILDAVDIIAFVLLYLALLNLLSITLGEGLIIALLVLLFSALVWSFSYSNHHPINLKKFFAILSILIILFMGIMPMYIETPQSTNFLDETIPVWHDYDPYAPPTTASFELLLTTEAGSRLMESYAFFIKQSLALLGIDVNIQAKPYSQLVGLHQGGQPFDLLVFQWPQPTNLVPELSWKYHSASLHPINNDIIDLNDNVTTFMRYDIGVNATQVDDLLEQIDVQTDPQERLDLLDQFVELYMNMLLYEYPLLSIDPYWAVIRGYGDDNNASSCLANAVDDKNSCNNDLYDEEEGMFASRALGAMWNPTTTPSYRSENVDLSTLQLRSKLLVDPNFFNPYLHWDKVTAQHLEPLIEGLFTIDKDLQLHPGIAYNYLEEDWFRPNQDEVVKGGKLTLFLNAKQQWQFPSTYNFTNQIVPAQPVDANDVATTLTLLTKYPSSLALLDPLNFVHLDHWTVNSTVFENDTITLYYSERSPNDPYNLAKLVPLPQHLLGGLLHLQNGTSYPFESVKDPLQSEEWQFFSTKEGLCLVGPYSLSSSVPREYYEYTARDDYPYPNEWDTADMYFTYHDNFSSYDTYNLSYFAPHINNGPTSAYYWTYGDDPSTQSHEKPMTQNIDTILLRTVDDDNAARILFEAGQLDIYQSSVLGAPVVHSDQDNPDYVVRESETRNPPATLVFNLNNDNLQKRDVRYAIASTLNRNEMRRINDGYSSLENSPVPSYFNHFRPSSFLGSDGVANTNDDLYWSTSDYAIPYNYQLARDLMYYEPYFPLVLNNTFLPSYSPMKEIYILTDQQDSEN